MENEKTPVVIIHEPAPYSAKLPKKYRFSYLTEVNDDTVTLTVSILRIRNPFMKALLGGDKNVKSAKRVMPRQDAQDKDAATTMESKLAYALFPKL